MIFIHYNPNQRVEIQQCPYAMSALVPASPPQSKYPHVLTIRYVIVALVGPEMAQIHDPTVQHRPPGARRRQKSDGG